MRILKAGKYFDANNADVYTMDINPYSCQQEILDKPEAERTVQGYARNLAAAAAGTGKFGLCRGGSPVLDGIQHQNVGEYLRNLA